VSSDSLLISKRNKELAQDMRELESMVKEKL
jgi:hypothetical protein